MNLFIFLVSGNSTKRSTLMGCWCAFIPNNFGCLKKTGMSFGVNGANNQLQSNLTQIKIILQRYLTFPIGRQYTSSEEISGQQYFKPLLCRHRIDTKLENVHTDTCLLENIAFSICLKEDMFSQKWKISTKILWRSYLFIFTSISFSLLK